MCLKIGELSSLAQVTIKTLRYYDELGLLKPARVDRESAYRSYRKLSPECRWRFAAARNSFGIRAFRERLFLHGSEENARVPHPRIPPNSAAFSRRILSVVAGSGSVLHTPRSWLPPSSTPSRRGNI